MTDTSDLYKIGNVAKLTGIAVERLRAWERRYGLAPAARDGKTRYFSAAQVERLTSIKRLIDQGHPVSTLINLDDTTLAERLQTLPSAAASDAADPTSAVTLGLTGTQLLMLEQQNTATVRCQVNGRWVNLVQCLAELTADPASPNTPASITPDVLAVLLGSVTPETLAELDALPETISPLIVYHYATEEGLAQANADSLSMLRWPVSFAELENAAARLARTPLRPAHRAPRRFSDEQLLTIASTGDGLGCACPADLVNLISALNAFSDHSAACASDSSASRPRKAPQAANRHAQIAERTSLARLELEDVLEDWVTAEGLLPVPN